MPLSTYSLFSEAELRDYITSGGTDEQSKLWFAAQAASFMCEQITKRQLVSRGSITEYHTIKPGDHLQSLYTKELPLVTVTSVSEDTTWPRTYGTTLVAGTDYELVAPDRIRRLGGGGAYYTWQPGSRVVRVVYTAGYKDQAGQPSAALVVPDDLKLAGLFIAASIFKESTRQRWGVMSSTDAAGTYQKYLGYVTPQVQALLDPYRRIEFHRTWELAA